MKACPDETTIGLLAVGGIHGRKAQKLVAHIKDCPQCRQLALKLNNMQNMLKSVEIAPDGRMIVHRPSISDEAKSRIKSSALAEFNRTNAMRTQLRNLIEKTMEIFRSFQSEQLSPLVGYAATMPEDPNLKDKLNQYLVRILEKLLDPSVPLAKRIALAQQMNKQRWQLSKKKVAKHK